MPCSSFLTLLLRCLQAWCRASPGARTPWASQSQYSDFKGSLLSSRCAKEQRLPVLQQPGGEGLDPEHPSNVLARASEHGALSHFICLLFSTRGSLISSGQKHLVFLRVPQQPSDRPVALAPSFRAYKDLVGKRWKLDRGCGQGQGSWPCEFKLQTF